MVHIQLEEIKRVFPMLAEEIQAGRSIVIEHQGQTFAYMKSMDELTLPPKVQSKWIDVSYPAEISSKGNDLSGIIEEMKSVRSEITTGTTAEELIEWINEGRE